VKQVDYIIVGCGLAGIALSEVLIKHQKSFLVFDNKSQQSSTVAAGMYNPVVLKRFTPVWKASEQLECAIPMYKDIEARLGLKIDYQFKLLRRFASIEEQNMWFSAADNPRLSPYLNLNLVKNQNNKVDAAYSFGIVNKAGRIDTALLVSAYRNFLNDKQLLKKETFQYNLINHQKDGIGYGNIKANHLIFSEGYGVKQNPFFSNIPLNGTKGEVLTVKIAGLNLDHPIKSSVFLIPLGNNFYRVGATYSHEDTTNLPTTEGREELIQKLTSFIKAPIELVDHKAGVRPTTKDRRPLVGRHPKFNNMYLLNGLGSRGVMIAPFVAKKLFDHVEFAESLDPEIDLNRFEGLFRT